MGGSTFMLATSMWALGVWNFSNLSSSTFSSLGSSSFSQSGSTRRGLRDGRVGEYEIEDDIAELGKRRESMSLKRELKN